MAPPSLAALNDTFARRTTSFLRLLSAIIPGCWKPIRTFYLDRGVEGLITVDTFIDRPLPLPAIAIPGHCHVEGVTNIVLDHRKAVDWR